jgi:hypothetical protein
MSAIPNGEVLATFDSYPEAQALVTTLVGEGVTPGALSIVGTDVTLVERVTGRMGQGRAALSSAMSGSWLGVLAGLVYVIFSPEDFVTPIFAGLLIGAGLGMVVGIILFTFARGPQRNFRSFQQVIAANYRVVVVSGAHAEALAAMSASGDTTKA